MAGIPHNAVSTARLSLCLCVSVVNPAFSKEAAPLAQDEAVEKILADDAAILPIHWQNLAWAAKSALDIKPIVNNNDFPYYGDLKVKE